MALYGLLAAAIAGGVLVLGGHPLTDVALLVGAAVTLVVVLALVSRRAGRPVPQDDQPPAEPDSPAGAADAGGDEPWTAFDDPRRGRDW